MAREPLLSVLMPAYNAAATLREAIESALDNGVADLEVVVVDDGSTDDTAAVIESIRHPALRRVRQPRNLGVGAARALALPLLRGRHLGLLDADDVAVAGRFERQLACLEAAGGPDIVGGAVEYFGEHGGMQAFPATDAEIRAGLLFHDLPLANPAVSMKLAPLRARGLGYADCPGAEDYALWAEALAAGLIFANLPAVVTRMRRHGGSLTRRRAAEIAPHARAVRARIAGLFFPQMAAAARTALVHALSVNIGGGRAWLDGAAALAQAAGLAAQVPRVDAGALRRLLAQNFLRMLDHALAHGLVDNEALEMLTETDAGFERWRMADGGALDRAIMARVTAPRLPPGLR